MSFQMTVHEVTTKVDCPDGFFNCNTFLLGGEQEEFRTRPKKQLSHLCVKGQQQGT